LIGNTSSAPCLLMCEIAVDSFMILATGNGTLRWL
jgi:hypothetical protein